MFNTVLVIILKKNPYTYFFYRKQAMFVIYLKKMGKGLDVCLLLFIKMGKGL